MPSRAVLQTTGTKSSDLSAIFDEIYQNGVWGDSEVPYSGGGSDPVNTRQYCQFVSRFLKQHPGIRSVLDLGCGDFRAGSRIDWNCCRVFAWDISPVVIEHNKSHYSLSNVHFDTVQDAYPNVDLVCIRQVFQHLCFDDIWNILRNFPASMQFALITDEQPCNLGQWFRNTDKPTDNFHRTSGLFLEMGPFNLNCSEVLRYANRERSGIFRTVQYTPSDNPNPNRVTRTYRSRLEGEQQGNGVSGFFDVMIPITDKDLKTLTPCLWSVRAFLPEADRIFLIGPARCEQNILQGRPGEVPFSEFEVVFICEDTFPFSMEDVRRIHGTNPRNGWYLQQLLKLYSPSVLPCRNQLLILDADVIFLRELTFLLPGNRFNFNEGLPILHAPYFIHLQKLLGLTRVLPISGIAHQMIFDREIISSLLQSIEAIHVQPAWQAILHLVEESERGGIRSGFSEYETVFNYALAHFRDKVQIRQTQWKDAFLWELPILSAQGYVYAGCHAYMQEAGN